MEERMSNSWTPFLKRTLRFPWRLITNLRLLLYFIIVICFIGALGAWIPLAQISFGNKVLTWLGVQRSLATYVIGIVVAAFADCVVRRREEDDPTFVLFLLGATLASAALAITVLLVDNDWVKTFSIVGTGVAAMVWLMVHDADPELTPGDTFSALGGENPK